VAIRPFVCEKKRFAQKFTDGQTDGRTDKRRAIALAHSWNELNIIIIIIIIIRIIIVYAVIIVDFCIPLTALRNSCSLLAMYISLDILLAEGLI